MSAVFAETFRDDRAAHRAGRPIEWLFSVLSDREGHRRLLEENLLRLARAIAADFPAGTRVSRPAGGFALWVEMPRGFDSRVLFDQALEQGICFAPGDVFSASRRFRNCLRLSAGSTWSERIEDGVRRLGLLARALLSA